MWLWARSETGRTGWTNIPGATSSSYTPTLADEDFFLRATVTYTDRRGGKSAEAVTDGPVPSANRRPRFPSTETGQRTIAGEHEGGHVNIGDRRSTAEDPEDARLTYTLTGPDAAAFTIVTSSGQLRTSEALDFETKSSYSVTVEVHDGRDGYGQHFYCGGRHAGGYDHRRECGRARDDNARHGHRDNSGPRRGDGDAGR